MDDGIPHIDSSDYYYGYNVVTGWGDFTSSKLLLWQLGLAVEIKPGDAILFFGRLFSHNAVDIQGGTRNIEDAFVHESVLSWHKKMVAVMATMAAAGKRKEAMVVDGEDEDPDYDPKADIDELEPCFTA